MVKDTGFIDMVTFKLTSGWMYQSTVYSKIVILIMVLNTGSDNRSIPDTRNSKWPSTQPSIKKTSRQQLWEEKAVGKQCCYSIPCEFRIISPHREKSSIQASQRRMERKLKELNATLDQERSQHVEQRDQVHIRTSTQNCH